MNLSNKHSSMHILRTLAVTALACSCTCAAAQDAAPGQDQQQAKNLNSVNVTAQRVPTLSERADAVKARFTAGHNRIKALNDGIIPDSADDQQRLWGTWGSRPFDQMWVEYRWEQPVEPSQSTVYFWADQSVSAQGGDCLNMGVQFPNSWKLMYYNDQGEWVEVPHPSGYPIRFGSGSDITFDKVRTTRLRLVMEPFGRGRCRAAVGLKEWEVD